MKLNYSLAYSAFGQATLDTLGHARAAEYVYSLGSNMLKAFLVLPVVIQMLTVPVKNSVMTLCQSLCFGHEGF